MKNNYTVFTLKHFIKKLTREKIDNVISVIAFTGVAFCIAAFIPNMRSIIITLAENLLGRQINHNHWNFQLIFMACVGIWLSTALLFMFSRQFQKLRIPAERKHRIYTAACVLLISVFAGALLFLAASNKSIWIDEVFSLAPVKHPWKTILAYSQKDVHPPLFFFMEKCWYLLFGDSIFAMRCLSILPAVLTMILAALFLTKECSGRAAVLFLLCFIASENISIYSIEIRMYSWALSFITLTAFCAWFIIKTGKAIWWGAFILCAEAAAYTHYYAAVIAALGYICLAAYILKHDRKNMLKAGVSAAAAVLLYLPWLPTAVNLCARTAGNGDNGVFLAPPVKISDIISYMYRVFTAGGSRIAHLCFFGLFCFVSYRFLIRKNKTKQEGFAFGGLCCFVMFAVISILILINVRWGLGTQYLFPGYGLVWLFFAIAGAAIRSKRAFVFLCACLPVIGTVTLSSSLYKVRKTTQEFMRFYSYMSKEVQPDDVFIFPPQEGERLDSCMIGIIAYLFPGHQYASGSDQNWDLLDSTHIEYEALSDTERFQGKEGWLIVDEMEMWGGNLNFVLPQDAKARWSGAFAGAGASFKLYRIGSPAAFAKLAKN